MVAGDDVNRGGGNDGGHDKQRSGGDGLSATMAEGAGELRVGDEALDAFAESGGLGHGEHAFGCPLRCGKANQQLRVAKTIAA